MHLIYGNKSPFVDYLLIILFKTQRRKKQSIFGEGAFINYTNTNTFTTNLKLKRANIVFVLAKNSWNMEKNREED